MQNKPFFLGPVALTATLTTNLMNPPTTTGGVGAGTPNTFILLKHLRVINTTSSPIDVSLFRGATTAAAAGTEFVWATTPVPADGVLDFYSPGVRFDAANFLTGGGSATGLTLIAEGEIGIA